jgi:hypothetical protein
MGKTESAFIDDSNAKTTFTASSRHGDLSGFNVQLVAVGLETDEVPLLDSARFASLGDDVRIRQEAIFCTFGEHFIPPVLH